MAIYMEFVWGKSKIEKRQKIRWQALDFGILILKNEILQRCGRDKRYRFGEYDPYHTNHFWRCPESVLSNVKNVHEKSQSYVNGDVLKAPVASL